MNIENHVLIYDFATGMAIKGHKGHSNSFIPNQTQYSSIVFTSPSQVISSFNSEIIQFCLNTNKYNIFPDFTSRNPITTMKIAPNHSGILAAGTRNGLVLLIDYENMNTIARMRGHDMEITSLDFLIVSSKSVDPLSQKPQKLQQQDDSDLFDIYSYEKVENEFGVYQETKEDLSDDEEDNNAEIQEKLHNTSNFNFLEECNTLKETILNEGGNDDINNESKSKIVSYEESQEQYRSNNAENISIDLSNETNKSSHTPVLTEESLNYAEECQRMKNDFQPKSEESIILVSGSRECTVWLWNVDEHRALKSIKWHPKSAKSALPAVFTNVLWIDQETLLITDNNGDIIEHKIRFDEKLTAIKDNKQKKSNNFDCKGVLSFCKSTDDSSLWVISIHRNICLFNATIANVKEKKEEKRYQKVISLDTLQYRVHCLIENPIDSHVIAIGGNDKRICLWNTSDPNHHTIILKPFMNKIQSGVLALCWHPQKDNLLAFGTREGRIGVLDTNKTTNVPIILQSFTSHEIYSLAWANFYKKTQGEEGGEKEKNEVILLLACSGGKLVYYTQKDYKLHHLKEFTEINSISTSCGSTSESKNHLIALGTNTGDLLICDMSCDFRILMQRKLSKKYVGMICWWENKRLACSSDAGVTLIRDVDKFMNDGGGEENVITLSNHKGRVYSVRFNKAGDQVVACCMHGYVDVWCVNEGRLVASLNIETPAYTAIFMPHNENTIICGGQDSTVFAFEWQKYSTTHSTTTAAASSSTSMQSMKREINSTDKFKNIEWATISELTTVSKHSKRRVKKKVKENVRNGNFEEEEITKAMSAKLNLNTNKKSHSIFIAANRELTNNSLGLMEMILKRNNNDLTDAASTASNDGSFDDDDDVDDESNKRELSLNELILGNRDDVKKAIDKECECFFIFSLNHQIEREKVRIRNKKIRLEKKSFKIHK